MKSPNSLLRCDSTCDDIPKLIGPHFQDHRMSDLTDFMDLEFSKIPWMKSVQPDVLVRFDVKVSTLKLVTCEADWGEVTEAVVEMRNIIDQDDDEVAEDGPHMVPFWAMEAFQEAIKATGKAAGKHWIAMGYLRRVYDKKNRSGETIEYSTPHFGASKPE